MLRKCLILFSLLALAPHGALAQNASDPNADAARLAEEAAAAYAAGDPDGAIALFEEAMTYVADPAFAYNVAFIYDELDVLFLAYRYYGRYLELYPGAPNRVEIEARRAELEALFATDYAELQVTTTPAGAELWVQSGERHERYGTSPMTLWVPAGSVTLDARLNGHAPASRQLNAVAGVRVPVELALTPLGESGSSVTSPLWPWAYGTMGTGVALMGVGIGFWAASNGTAEDYNSAVARITPDDPNPPSLDELRALGADAEDQASVGNVLFGVGAAVLAGGVVLFVLALDDGGELAAEPDDTARGWHVQPSGLGFELLGRF